MKPYLVGLAAALSVAAPPARGQAAPARAPADSAAADSARPAVRLEPIVVTATRTPERRDRIGFATSTATPDPLGPVGGSAAEALASMPGISLDQAAGPGGPTIVRLRGGEEVFTQILLDGVQLNQNGGFFDFQGFQPSNLDRVEVARGPFSALYGSSAVSGVVQFVTRAGRAGPPRFDWSTEAGAAAVHGAQVQSAAAVGGGTPGLRYSAGYGTGYQRGIFAVPHDIWTQDASLRLDAAPGSRVRLTGVFRFAGMDAHLPVRDPGATRVPLDSNARNSRDRVVATVRATVPATRAWRHELALSLYRETFVYDDRRDGVDGTPLGIFIFDANFMQRSTLRRGTADYLASVTLPANAGLDYGLRVEREDLRDRTAGDFGDGDLPLGRTTTALHAEAHARPTGRLTFLAGGRVEFIPGQAGQVTPRASAVADLVPDVLSVHGAVGRAFKTPNLQQQYLSNPFIVANPDLRPETSTGWEAGVTARTRNRRASLTVGFFHQRYRDLIRTVALPGGSQQINRNLGDSRAVGIEWAAAVRPAPGLDAGLSGTWLRTTILTNTGLAPSEYPEGAPLPFRPSVTGTAYLRLSAGHWSFTPRATLVGAQTVLSERFSGQRVRLDAYALAGATLAWEVTHWGTPFVRVDNAFNQGYQTGFDRPGVPRTISGGLRITHQ